LAGELRKPMREYGRTSERTPPLTMHKCRRSCWNATPITFKETSFESRKSYRLVADENGARCRYRHLGFIRQRERASHLPVYRPHDGANVSNPRHCRKGEVSVQGMAGCSLPICRGSLPFLSG